MRVPLGIAVCAGVAVACVDQLDLFCEPGLPGPIHFPTIQPFGNGHDGARTIDSTVAVNECGRVVAVDGMRVGLAVSIGAEPGDAVLFLVVQDEEEAGRRAGSWSIARVSSLGTGSSVVLDGTPPDSAFTRSQLCTVPEYTTLEVESGGQITASLWNGETGGVVAFYASTLLSLGGILDAGGEAFRGGIVNPVDTTNERRQFGDVVTTGQGAGKGESIDARAYALLGRGEMGNGGGGGNSMNAGGGGGGGSFAAGGHGGTERENAGEEDFRTRGRGGRPADLPFPERLVFGGGGGAGHVTSASASSTGGRGGGIVLVFARRIEGNGYIDAEGGDAPNATDNGGGGGGGGGTVLLIAESVDYTGIIEANGGAGGDVSTSLERGPGGGGGGGRVYAPGFVDASIDVDAGYNGLVSSVAWGATNGGPGIAIVD